MALKHLLGTNAMLTCSMQGPPGTPSEAVTEEGLLYFHEYGLARMECVVDSQQGQHLIVKLKNPHGLGGEEWNGEFGDGDPRWSFSIIDLINLMFIIALQKQMA